MSTEEQRTKFAAELTEAEDWLYMDGEGEAVDAFKAKLKALKDVGEPIVRRANVSHVKMTMSWCK